jgi:membrane-bound inhibitor of C-type lysozyme
VVIRAKGRVLAARSTGGFFGDATRYDPTRARCGQAGIVAGRLWKDSAMTTTRQSLSWGGAALMVLGLAGCETTEFNQATGGTSTLVCDGGKTFTITYADGFETAIIESDGERVELTRVRTSLGMTPTPGLGSSSVATWELESTQTSRAVRNAGTTGVRYSDADGETIFLSRGREAVLEIGGVTYSNCETPA